MEAIHERKNADYSSDNNPYSNFEYAAKISEVFSDPVDRVFAVLIGIKFARISELTKGKTPLNESLNDSFLDVATYQALWSSYRMNQQKDEKDSL